MDIQISSLPLSNNVQNDDILLINRGGADYSASVNSLLSSVNDNINAVNTTLTSTITELDNKYKFNAVPLNYGQSAAYYGAAHNIPENGNLNDYIMPGVYYITSGAIGQTIVNGPADVNCCGTLIVSSSFGQTINHAQTWQYIYQELSIVDGPAMFRRQIYSGATAGVYTFEKWICLSAGYGEPYPNVALWHPSRICGQLGDKWIYMKVVDYSPSATIGSTTTVTAVNIPHGISSAYQIIGVDYAAINTSGGVYALPNALNPSSSGATVDNVIRANSIYGIDGTNLSFRITKDSWGTNYIFRFFIKYIKK